MYISPFGVQHPDIEIVEKGIGSFVSNMAGRAARGAYGTAAVGGQQYAKAAPKVKKFVMTKPKQALGLAAGTGGAAIGGGMAVSNQRKGVSQNPFNKKPF